MANWKKLAMANIPPIASLPFQLTTSRGGRPWLLAALLQACHFNSRPREKVDKQAVVCTICFDISTHDLTRRSTSHQAAHPTFCIISTHDLARRSTRDGEEPKRAHLFQLTTSQGGRPEWRLEKIGKSSLSTHDLARRSTLAIVRDEQVCYYFNSRPHEEVDLVLVENDHLYWYFNSRPREEVDISNLKKAILTNTFQLTTSRGGRH